MMCCTVLTVNTAHQAQPAWNRASSSTNGTWHDAPVLTGQTAFTPLASVKNILVTGGEGFM